MNLTNIKNRLKTMPIQQVADLASVQVADLRYILKINGMTTGQIKADHARWLLTPIAAKHTVVELAQITGFSPRKVSKVIKLHGLKTKHSK
jgi:hypothetical protein